MAMGGSKSKWLLFFVSIVLSIVLAEATLALLKPAPLFRKINFVTGNYTYMLSPNEKLVYEPKPNTGEFNKYGHRGATHEFTKGNKRRLLFIGDSVVEGIGVGADKRFTELLDEKLSNKKLEIINLGVEGYSLVQEFEYLKEKALKFSPDYVIWCLTFNDLHEASAPLASVREMLNRINRNHFYKEYYRCKESAESFLCGSQLYRYGKLLAMYLLSGESNTALPYDRRSNVEVEERVFKQLPKIAKERKVQFLFVLLPVNVRSGQWNDLPELERMLIRNNVRYVDLNKYLTVKDGEKDSLFQGSDPCHFSEKGHEAVADAFFRFMKYYQGGVFLK